MSGVESYPYPVKEGQRYINFNPGRLFVQQQPKRERDREGIIEGDADQMPVQVIGVL